MGRCTASRSCSRTTSRPTTPWRRPPVRFALAGSRVPADAAARPPPAPRGRGHPGQGEPVRVGQLPRLHPDRSAVPQRLERRGGFTRNPYVLDWDPCGSSSGSAVAAAANLCAATVGTETDGSVICPAGNNLVVGVKPTLGLISQHGHHPHRPQPGHGRSDHPHVTDAADHAQCDADARSGRWQATRCRPTTPPSSSAAPSGGRADRRRPAACSSPDYFALPEINAVVEQAIDVMAGPRRRRSSTRRHGRHVRVFDHRVQRPAL